MGQHFGAFTWLLLYDEAGNQHTVRALGSADPVKGQLYIERSGAQFWLKTRSSPAEGNSHRYSGTPFTAYQDMLKLMPSSHMGLPWLQQKTTPNT